MNWSSSLLQEVASRACRPAWSLSVLHLLAIRRLEHPGCWWTLLAKSRWQTELGGAAAVS
jgi:hypothetical protein